MVNAKQEAITILNDALKELESPKGSVASGVQKLLRAASILNEEQIISWCNFHLGKPDYIEPVENYLKALIEQQTNKNKLTEEAFSKAELNFKKSGVKLDYHFDNDDLNFLHDEAGGGVSSISFIEEKYADLVKNKRGNDGTYYKSHLFKRIAHIKRKSQEKAIYLLNKYVYTNTTKTTFDFLKEEVDDKLLDLNPELAEKLMIAFKSVSSDNPEEWSHALTSCRRLIEGLADELFPSIDNDINGRKLGQQQYINRLWAFMDKAIESESNRELAKTHIDFLGSYLQKTHKLTNKGVHTSITKIEAVKTVFHTYLLIADILGYLDKSVVKRETKLNIHTATLDELESILSIKRTTAKEIIKLRALQGTLTPELLENVQGIGQKTVAKAQELFSFDLIE
ncbi:ComEA family DNA-binding protein [Anabaena catenula]|uniref:Helix-hairpin-helix domain-containing protein n=1 Tax=Anabaena catenula FACHB-362 TaxID=2692877 RepID=A0ABR8J0C4_9NOST|nr:helix-hairpin-helix domain-containing protein [Anabaena catenula]MBD2691540.1 helix-hairpin-helix domain-containing protein [Anabaena catenula FACHB-362]